MANLQESPPASAVKRVRRSNFSSSEIAILVDEASLHHDVLNASFSSTVTNKLKNGIWEKIAQKINANTAGNRTPAELRKKWNDLKCQVKRKAQTNKRERMKTGGGDAPNPLNDVEQKLLTVIPVCQIEGIEGGLETSMPSGSTITLTAEEVIVHMDAELTGPEPDLPEASTSQTEPTPTPTPTHHEHQKEVVETRKKKKAYREPMPAAPSHVLKVVDLEAMKSESLRKLVDVEKERLEVEKRRLQVEMRREALEEKLLKVEEEKLDIMKKQAAVLATEMCVSPIIQF